VTAGAAPAGPAPVPAGRYVAATWSGDVVVTAGMTPKGPDEVLLGRGVVGADVPVERASELAAAAADRAVAAVAALVEAAGAERVPLADGVPTQLTVFLRSTPAFEQHSLVADGASARIAAVFGGRLPARAAVGVASLPGGAPVEVVLHVRVPRVSDPFRTVTAT
jgi:enamine deaminase RidA (YjgF/YER057c/UK114 family)